MARHRGPNHKRETGNWNKVRFIKRIVIMGWLTIENRKKYDQHVTYDPITTESRIIARLQWCHMSVMRSRITGDSYVACSGQIRKLINISTESVFMSWRLVRSLLHLLLSACHQRDTICHALNHKCLYWTIRTYTNSSWYWQTMLLTFKYFAWVNKNMFTFFIINIHWVDTCSWNPFSCKEAICVYLCRNKTYINHTE